MWRWAVSTPGVAGGGAPARATQEVLLVLDPSAYEDDDDFDTDARRLRRELADLDVGSVRAAEQRAAPEGAKGLDLESVGSIVVAMSGAGGVLPTVIGTVGNWLQRARRRGPVSVTLDGDTLVLDSASVEERKEIIEAFVRRHGAA